MTSLPLAGGLRRGAILAVLACALIGPAEASADEGAPQIVGGSEADISAYPWQVALEFNDAYYQGTARERFACGGTLIAIDQLGQGDPSPAHFRWKVRGKRHHGHGHHRQRVRR